MHELVRELVLKLAGPLPGVDGQRLMSPRPRAGWRPIGWPEDCRPGGALLLLYPLDGQAHVLLTVRDAGLTQHGGQVSLPGGALRPGESTADAAVREAHEEVGLDPAAVRVLGGLTPLHVPISSFVIHPWVATCDDRPDFAPDPREVSRLLEVSLVHLQSPAHRGIESRQGDGGDVEIPFFAVAGERVWGATAMILAEFLCLLGTPPVR
jgi:8-oxo-dGTP pyrophosphatase MutT (NUDIX family)